MCVRVDGEGEGEVCEGRWGGGGGGGGKGDLQWTSILFRGGCSSTPSSFVMWKPVFISTGFLSQVLPESEKNN